MAGFNPFAPQAQQQQQPQMQGFQVPNVAMQSKPGLMETIAPTVMQQAMSSDAAGSIAKGAVDLGKQGAMDAWSALTGPAVAPSAIPVTESVGVFTDAAMLNGMGTGVTAAAPTLAATGATAAEIAAGAGALAAPVATTAATTAAGAAPLALMAGPFAPLVLGGMMVAANSGK
tara:strand:+ start:269 stop:787 length:519 start_codon:yes stop_codon:yes gene_type:complete